MQRSIPLILIPLIAACATTPAAPPPEAGPQAPPSTPAPTPPAKQAEPGGAWWHEAVFYEIFVRSFQDSDGDGIGDLRGIINRLDYLNDGDPQTTTDLGVTALWLMPIFESPSYHGYDVTDYYRVDPDYGTEEDLKALLDACHARGIHVIVDFMLNHTSSQHPWFEAAQDPSSDKRSWYIFSDVDPGWRQPWGGGPTWHALGDEYFYGVFWEGMPDLDFTKAEVEAEFGRIGAHWLAMGVDGFRLDAIRHLVEDGSSAPDVPQTHDILKRLVAEWKSQYPQALLIGEVWSGPQDTGAYYGQGDELDLTYDFHIAGGIVGAVSQKRAEPLLSAVKADLTWHPVQRMSAPFITNHDMDRIASILGGDVDRLKLAATALMTLPGTPFVYYGEEIGLKNTGRGGDEAKRAPMQWQAEGPGHGFTTAQPWDVALGVGQKYSVEAHEGDEASLLNHYRRIIHMRQASPALSSGLIFGLRTAADGSILVFQRAIEGEIAVVAINFGTQAASPGPIPLSADALDLSQLREMPGLGLSPALGEGGTLDVDGRSLSVGPIPPLSAWVGLIGGAE